MKYFLALWSILHYSFICGMHPNQALDRVSEAILLRYLAMEKKEILNENGINLVIKRNSEGVTILTEVTDIADSSPTSLKTLLMRSLQSEKSRSQWKGYLTDMIQSSDEFTSDSDESLEEILKRSPKEKRQKRKAETSRSSENLLKKSFGSFEESLGRDPKEKGQKRKESISRSSENLLKQSFNIGNTYKVTTKFTKEEFEKFTEQFRTQVK